MTRDDEAERVFRATMFRIAICCAFAGGYLAGGLAFALDLPFLIAPAVAFAVYWVSSPMRRR